MPKPTPILFTQDGYDKLKQEHDELQRMRPEFVRELTKAAEMGDRSENAAYKYAKQKLRSTDSRLRYLSRIIDRARIVKASQSEFVEIGSHVVVNNGTKDITFQIVGGNESDPSKGLLSYQSPLGQQLLGKKAGDFVQVLLPNGMAEYTVRRIE